jgi:hypothetical protein
LAKKGKKASRKAKSATEWTFLEKALAVICAVLVVIAAYAFTVREEIVEVGSIETYDSTVDLRAGDSNASEFSFTRHLKVDYRVKLSYRTHNGNPGDGPDVHFKVWNESQGRTLFHEITAPTYDRDYVVDTADAGTYDFHWWVEGDSGSVRVDIDALIQPTEKLFEKRR